VPWRARAAESVLLGARPDAAVLAAAARSAIAAPFTVPGTAFKVPLAERTIVRMLVDLTEAGS
jgi:xanthine dehydrogenase YagS FAD-binding subunit